MTSTEVEDSREENLPERAAGNSSRCNSHSSNHTPMQNDMLWRMNMLASSLSWQQFEAERNEDDVLLDLILTDSRNINFSSQATAK